MTNEEWAVAQQAVLAHKSRELTEVRKKKYALTYLGNSLTMVPARQSLTGERLAAFQASAERLISALPEGPVDAASDKAYFKLLAEYKGRLLKEYKIVPDGYYLAVMMPLGIAIGLPMGVAFKNIAIGVAIGPAIGLMIGAIANAQAKKKGLIIPS